MQITIDVSKAKTPADIAEIIRQTANTFSPIATTTATPAPKKTAKPVDDEDEEIETVEDDEDTDTEADEVEETEDDADDEVTLKAVQKAFREYAAENGDAKALKVLKTKFNVKSLKDLKPAQYKKAIQAVAV
jgi:hypothetical protein